MSFQVEIVMSKSSEDEVEFPAVTLCPLNKVHCTNLHLVLEDIFGGIDSNNTQHLLSLCVLYTLGDCFVAARANEIFRLSNKLSKFPKNTCK